MEEKDTARTKIPRIEIARMRELDPGKGLAKAAGTVSAPSPRKENY